MAQHSVFHPLRVSAIDELTDDAVAITFEVPDDLRADYAFAHGQHLNIRGGDDVRRSYSICTPPSSGVLPDRREAAARRSVQRERRRRAAGRRRARGDDARPGGSPPQLDPTAAKTYVAIAAGSGITPVLSIVAAILEGEPGSFVTLVYANRTSRSVMFLDEVHDLKDRFPERFQIVHVLSRETQDVELLSGPARRRAAAPDPRVAGAGRRRRRLVPVRPAADGGRAARACSTDVGAHRDPHRALPRRPGAARAGRRARGRRRGRRLR